MDMDIYHGFISSLSSCKTVGMELPYQLIAWNLENGAFDLWTDYCWYRMKLNTIVELQKVNKANYSAVWPPFSVVSSHHD